MDKKEELINIGDKLNTKNKQLIKDNLSSASLDELYIMYGSFLKNFEESSNKYVQIHNECLVIRLNLEFLLEELKNRGEDINNLYNEYNPVNENIK